MAKDLSTAYVQIAGSAPMTKAEFITNVQPIKNNPKMTKLKELYTQYKMWFHLGGAIIGALIIWRVAKK